MMPPAAAMTATETPASPSMCRKAPRTLMSDLSPRLSSHAETPLTTTASAATTIMVVEATGCGSLKRRIASQAMAPVATSRITPLAKADRIEAACMRKVNRLLGFQLAMAIAPQARMRPSTSPKL